MANKKADDDKIAIVLEVVSLRYDACHIFQGQPLKRLHLTILRTIARAIIDITCKLPANLLRLLLASLTLG
jgi:hypothetical protein